ncbi:NTP transferase domain-containing protein, partial [Candidatus Gracilibacteria bacterium]|nr:NTP transferase domain-containing protein [Candidatus Gracilibacteria bacterium]
MKGIILAGGKGTRLLPFTKFTNKHLLPIHDRAMISYPLETLRRAGIREILIVTDGKFLADFKKLLGNGRKFGVRLSFAVQKKADGIAGALKLSEKFAVPRCGSGQANESIAVILGDNIFEASLRSGLGTGFKKDVLEFERRLLISSHSTSSHSTSS